MDTDRLRQAAVVGGVVTGIVAGATGDYGSADETDSLVIPANYAFGIWGPIYAGALAYASYQALPSKRTDPLLRGVGWPSAVGYLASGLWVHVLPRKRFFVTEALLAITVAAAAVAYGRTAGEQPGPQETWLVRTPLGLYAGWISLAAAASTTEALLLEDVGGLGLGETPWAVLVVLAAGAIAGGVAWRVPNSPAYPAAVSWGLAGTAVQQFRRSQPVGVAAAVVSALLARTAARTAGHRR